MDVDDFDDNWWAEHRYQDDDAYDVLDVRDANRALACMSSGDEDFGLSSADGGSYKVIDPAAPASVLHVRDDEAICPVTRLAYFKALGRSPYVDEDGRQAW